MFAIAWRTNFFSVQWMHVGGKRKNSHSREVKRTNEALQGSLRVREIIRILYDFRSPSKDRTREEWIYEVVRSCNKVTFQSRYLNVTYDVKVASISGNSDVTFYKRAACVFTFYQNPPMHEGFYVRRVRELLRNQKRCIDVESGELQMTCSTVRSFLSVRLIVTALSHTKPSRAFFGQSNFPGLLRSLICRQILI